MARQRRRVLGPLVLRGAVPGRDRILGGRQTDGRSTSGWGNFFITANVDLEMRLGLFPPPGSTGQVPAGAERLRGRHAQPARALMTQVGTPEPAAPGVSPPQDKHEDPEEHEERQSGVHSPLCRSSSPEGGAERGRGPQPCGPAAPASGPPTPTRYLHLGSRRIGVVGPSIRDPRLRLSAVIATLQVLGQTVLGFKVSIAQILVTVAMCALIDAAVTLYRQKLLVWPASGLLTGNSIAFILRASGTGHGRWWSLHGIGFFALAGLLSLLSKYLLRPGGRHLFNPSNLGIVWTLLLIGPTRVYPQYLWWGPLHTPVLAALAVIVVGGVWVLKAVRMFPMAGAFLATLAGCVGVFALAGHSFVAVWHSGPVGGMSYWLNISFSPELLIFAFFMMSDPQTTPKRAEARVAFGILTALVAATLVFFQPTEFGIKLAILASLTFACALAPALDRLDAGLPDWRAALGRPSGQNGYRALLRPVIAVVTTIALAAPAGTASVATNRQVILIERGLSGSKNPQ